MSKFEVSQFDTIVDELRTLPCAWIVLDGFIFEARVYPDQTPDGFKQIAIVCEDQGEAVQDYCNKVLDQQELQAAHHNATCDCGAFMQVDRTFLLKAVPGDRLNYV